MRGIAAVLDIALGAAEVFVGRDLALARMQATFEAVCLWFHHYASESGMEYGEDMLVMTSLNALRSFKREVRRDWCDFVDRACSGVIESLG